MGGFGCMAPKSKGCCLSIGELCCCAGTCKSATCCDDDGCVASTSKCCCCLAHGEVPPSNTPGIGCDSPGGSDPCCKQEGKLCCLWTNLETDTCCDDGWIELTTKSCCCVTDASYPAGRTPGFVCCNY